MTKKMLALILSTLALVLLINDITRIEAKPEYLTAENNLGDRLSFLISITKQSEGIEIIVDNIPIHDIYSYETLEKKDNWRIPTHIKNIVTAYSLYKDEIRSFFPQKIYLVKNMFRKSDGKGINAFYSRHENTIYLDASVFLPTTLHHELFHSIQAHMDLPAQVKTRTKNLDGCELISENACKSQKEYQAELWAYSLIGGKTSYNTILFESELNEILLKQK